MAFFVGDFRAPRPARSSPLGGERDGRLPYGLDCIVEMRCGSVDEEGVPPNSELPPKREVPEEDGDPKMEN